MKRLTSTLAANPFFRSSGLVLAVSGGVDSMVMLDAFFRMRHVHQSPLKVGHVNHHTGRFARQSQRLVQRFCDSRGIPVCVGDFEWNGRGNFEFEAAQFRRRFLDQVGPRDGWIVLAHHQDDQVETCLLALLRGARLTTPISMSERSGSRLRPFLNMPRNLILDHAARADVPHVLDPSNYDLTRLRNRIRHRLLPPLEERHHHFADRLGGWLRDFENLQRALIDWAQTVVDEYDVEGILSRQAFPAAPRWLWPFVLHVFWSRCGQSGMHPQVDSQILTWLDRDACGHLRVRHGHVHCDLDGLVIWRHDEPPNKSWPPGTTGSWGPLRFRVDVTPKGRKTLPPWIRSFHERGATLESATSIPRHIRDVMRKIRLPHRYRTLIPNLRIGDNTLHLMELIAWSRNGLTVFEAWADDIFRAKMACFLRRDWPNADRVLAKSGRSQMTESRQKD